MTKKVAKIQKVYAKLKEKTGDQALIRYFFSKDSEVKANSINDRMQEFIEKEVQRVPSSEAVVIESTASFDQLRPVLQQLVPYKVDVQALLSDSSLVGTTFLDELFESRNHGYSSLHFSNIGEVLAKGHSNEIENSRISRILPINEPSNELEESSGFLKQLNFERDSLHGSSKKRDVLKKMLEPGKKLTDLKWEVNDFFDLDSGECDYPVMHFFEPKSQNVYFVDVKALEKQKLYLIQNKLTDFKEPLLDIFKKKQVKWGQEIPRHHKSICIPEDCIILTGGLTETEDGIRCIFFSICLHY